MSWLRIDDGFVEHAKVSRLRDRTFRLHVAGLCYCARNLTDGHVSAKGVKVLSAILEYGVTKQVTELVEGGLWRPDQDGDGYWINDYLEYNPSAEQLKKRRQERSEAGRQGALKRWHADGNSHSSSHSNSHDSSYGNSYVDAAYPPSQPSPSQSTSKPPPTPSAEGGSDESLFGSTKRLVSLLPKSQWESATPKIVRTIRSNRCSEADIIAAADAASGPNVRDRLAVILAELKKRGDARRAA